MNKTKIEWCDYTWNPVTGCLNNCWYCYAVKVANRFSKTGLGKLIGSYSNQEYDKPFIAINGKIDPYPVGFNPTFHRYRLDEPKEKKKGSKIFVCSMADLFGDWVPVDWIREVFETINKTPWHTYLFLTKNPQRYAELLFPKNCYLGVSLTGEETIEEVGLVNDIFREIKNIKFISYEPLLAMPNMLPGNIDWVIIGGLTPKPQHEQKWVEKIKGFFRLAKVPVFLKDNLKWHEVIKEYPEEDK